MENHFCGYCGHELKPGARFCPYCGKELGDREEKAPEEVNEKPRKIAGLNTVPVPEAVPVPVPVPDQGALKEPVPAPTPDIPDYRKLP